jgi:NADPH:quinone reductase-like Zn-dependent oxidoreductase
VAVGSAVTRFAVVDEVFVIGKGTYPEYAAAKDTKLALTPENFTFEQAAVVPVSGLKQFKVCGTSLGSSPGKVCL